MLFAPLSLGSPRFSHGPETLSFSMDAPILTLDPLAATDAASQRVLNLLHSALVVRGEGLAMEPDLAESWQKLPGGAGLVFRLRPLLRFEDGEPLTNTHVVESLRRFFKESRQATQFKAITAVEARGGREVLLRFGPRTLPSLIQDLYLAKIYKEEGGRRIGAGRYRLWSAQPGVWTIQRNAHHWEAPRPGVPRFIRLSHTRDDTTRYQSFLRGDIDLMQSSLSLSKTDHLRRLKLPWVWVRDHFGIGAQYVAFNFRNPALKDHRVRLALAKAFNRDALARLRFKQYVTIDDTILNPLLPEYLGGLPHPSYDLAAAEKLLDEAGLPRQGGPSGIRLTLMMKLTPVKEPMDLARIFAADLEKIGVRLNLQVTETARYFDDLKNGRFDLFTSRWVSVTEPHLLYRAFHSSQDKDLNRGAYSNTAVDRALEQGQYQEAQRLMAEDLPYIFLWRWNHTIIATEKIKPFTPLANGDLIVLSKVVKGE